MPKFLWNNLDWNTIKVVGFDMDGTLYDEINFISQVYTPISEILAEACKQSSGTVFRSLIAAWKEKGSSYAGIFSDFLKEQKVDETTAKAAVQQCLIIFRGFKPKLTVDNEIEALLNKLSKTHPLFLFTDGKLVLQESKIKALRLERWFTTEQIFISGKFGEEFQKPSTAILSKISILDNVSPETVLYVGDRQKDCDFAKKAGFQFVWAK